MYTSMGGVVLSGLAASGRTRRHLIFALLYIRSVAVAGCELAHLAGVRVVFLDTEGTRLGQNEYIVSVA